MELDILLQRVAVLGAGGKMGRGIALLMLQEMARAEAERFGTVGGGTYRLTLIDTGEEALSSLRPYLRSFIRKYAEKQINILRGYFAENLRLVSNGEIIDHFVDGALDIVRLDPHLEGCYTSSLIFEAIIEDIDLKGKVLSSISTHNQGEFYVFTNTSSIPVAALNEKGSLDGKIIGFHFYNPPAVQKLLELIPIQDGNTKLTQVAEELAKRLGKTVVVSKDVAGFIGNGHLLREVAFACKKVEVLAETKSLEEAIAEVNRITQQYLVRPMGIFQLLDYVGLDVAHFIITIMNTHSDEKLKAPLVDQFLKEEIKGGQNPDGSQKDGIFHYEKGIPVSVYSLTEKKYVPMEKKEEASPSWRVLMKDPNRDETLRSHFDHLMTTQSDEAVLAREFLQHSNDVCRNLVNQGVAQKIEDINTVLINGFYHLYGPENTVIKMEVKQ